MPAAIRTGAMRGSEITPNNFKKVISMRSSRSSATGSVIFLLGSGAVWAQTLAANTDAAGASDGLDQIIVTGSRPAGLKGAASPAPIQIVNAGAPKATGAP